MDDPWHSITHYVSRSFLFLYASLSSFITLLKVPRKWIKTEYHASTFLLRAQLSNSFGIIYLGELADPNLREPGNRRVRMQVAQIQDTLR
jgi:hypothetical protein